MNNAQSIPSVPILHPPPPPPRALPSCRDFVVTKSAICLVSVRSKDGAVVRALTSHQSDLGSNPGVNTICMWVEFVVGSLLFSERFSSGYSYFPLSSKNNIFKFQFNQDQVDEEPPCECATSKSLFYLFSIIIRAEFSSRQTPVHLARLFCQLLSVA